MLIPIDPFVTHDGIVARSYEGKGQAEALPYPRPSQRPGGLVAGAVMHGTHTTTLTAILRKGTVGGFSKCGGVNLGCRTLLRCVHLEPKLR